MLKNLPSAYFAGIRIVSLTKETSVIRIQDSWYNRNPFHSIYFASLSIAAEISTGILCMGNIYRHVPPVSMLMTSMDATYHKKATGRILFTCQDGIAIAQTIDDVIAGNGSKQITCYSSGRNDKGETVAEFHFTWSFKVKSR